MQKITLKKDDLINRENIELECFPGYIEGMKIESARMIGSCLTRIFHKELNKNG